MGFLERLRQQMQTAGEAARRAAEEQERSARRQVEENRRRVIIRRQEEARILKTTEERKKRTGDLWQQSEFPKLANEVASIVAGTYVVNGVIRLEPIKGYDDELNIASNIHNRRFYKARGGSSASSFIEDLAGLSLIWSGGSWERAIVDDRPSRFSMSNSKDFYSEWTYESRVIVIGCDYQGTIVIRKSRGDIRLGFNQWSNNPARQEEVLGKAFNNPRKFYYTRNNLPYIPPVDGPGIG
ncbi:MAG: hypothetical protein HYU48_00665 [Candidatus Levybacteria bacterium]|nr:hypothetical protein [Candidatus Levybacteria bacterium]